MELENLARMAKLHPEDLKREAKQLLNSKLLQAFFIEWRDEIREAFENVSHRDADELAACNIRLRTVNDFREFIHDRCNKAAAESTATAVAAAGR